MAKPRTLYDKIWDDHLVDEQPDGTCLIYIDRHLVHEVTSPQAFEGLRLAGRKVRAPDKTLLVVDHNVPTTDRRQKNPDPESEAQIAYLAENAKFFDLEYYDEFDKRQGIVHIIGPEQGFTLPGVTLVCGDSHTATNGALGALAYGIGTSEVEHVLATQTLIQSKSKNMRAVVDGKLPPGVTAKDIILAIIGEIGTAGGTGYALEYAGEAIRALSMEGRMTVCNMSVEAGAKAGFIAPDEKTYEYLKGRPKAPKGKDWEAALAYWQTLQSDDGAHFDREIKLDAAKLPPLVTWGTSPEQVVSVTGRVPRLDGVTDEKKREAIERALAYMGLQGGEKISDIAVDREGDVRARRPEPLHQGGQRVDAGQWGDYPGGAIAAALILAEHADRGPDLGQALPAQPLGLGQGSRGVGRIVLHGQPRALHVQQGDHQGVTDDVVQLARHAVAFLGPGLGGQARLRLPQLGDQVELVPDQQAGRRGERAARHPRGPARVGPDPQPFGREQRDHAGQVDQAVAAPADQRGPPGEQADREPDDVVRPAVADDGDPGRGQRDVGEQRLPPTH